MFKATKLKRLAFFLTFDIVIFVASFYLAYLLRFSGVLPDYFRGGLVAGCATMVVLKLFFMWLFKIYKVPWRFFGLNEARKIFLVHLCAIVCFWIVYFAMPAVFNPFPQSVVILIYSKFAFKR